MPTTTAVASHYDAIKDVAKSVGMKVIVDLGVDSHTAVFADDTYAQSGPDDKSGVCVEVSFNERGEVKEAHKRVDGVSKGDVSGHVGNAGQRLLWTLHQFSRR